MSGPAKFDLVPAAAPSPVEFDISGMTCNNCARHVTEAIQAIAGVASATVSLEQAEAVVRWRTGARPDIEGVIQAVKAAGFGAKQSIPTVGAGETKAHTHVSGWSLNLFIGLACTVPLMAGEWIFRLGMESWYRWASFGLAMVVQVFCGVRFYCGAWKQLCVGRSNMDTLVALGSTTAFIYSAWALFTNSPGHLYFMEAASIITLISTGHWLEARVSARASSSLKALLNLAPALARRCEPDGRESEVPVAELKPGETVVLKPGDRVPVDGEVIEGGSAVDESMLTGESIPVDKASADKLYAGTVNLNGRLLMKVTATGEATALAHIVAAVQRAQSSRADIQRLGDRVSSVFVPVVVVVAVAAALWWGLMPEQANRFSQALAPYLWPIHPPASALAAAMISAVAVLIIACPCAMGLATPAAIMAGSNAAAQRGILIRDGIALEKAGQVTAVLFDKTGTLTVGKPEVARLEVYGSAGPAKPEVELKIAAALARRSNHPLSQAVAKLCTDDLDLTDWQEIRGAGVTANVGREVSVPGEQGVATGMVSARLGSLKWLRDCGVDLTSGNGFVNEWSGQGATMLGLGLGASCRGVFAIKDTIKPGADKVVRQLQRQGLSTYLVTGDNPLTATSIARQTGIPVENVFAEVRPEQKAELIRKLQSQGERVAFVGDGINDAPALEQADLGIAVCRASDIAREAADIILLRSEIEAVPESLGLARATLRTIKQNLFWAFFYNAVGIPLAALGFMSPVLCALAMGLSDLVVIGNALRLRHGRLKTGL